jgi:type IV pilus assembly protein PilW
MKHSTHKKSLAASQRGLTMVELLVAMAISTVLALAAISALVVSRQGFTTVDVASQLRDNARFATDLIQRLGVQSGFKDVSYAATQRVTNMAGQPTNPEPNVSGFNNASISASVLTAGTDPLAGTMGAGVNGSDILVLRFQTTETFPGSGVADKSMIDCSGSGSAAVAGSRDDRLISILHVATSEGEPSLMCTTLVPSSTGTYTTTALVRGVETFQVLYGADGVTPLTASAALTPASGGTFGLLPKIFLRADQMVVGGDATSSDTYNNWRRVRALRIGMVLRGQRGSAQDTSANPTYYPLGPAPSSSAAGAGTALSSTSDAGTRYTPSTSEGRLRQTITFTVHLRNEQGY